MIEEVNRMQQLAGINEIKINNPTKTHLYLHPNSILGDSGYYMGKNETTVFFYDKEKDVLITDNEPARKFILDKKIPLFKCFNNNFKIENASLCFEFNNNISEIKVNKPTVKWSSVLQLISDLHKLHGHKNTTKEVMRIASKLGWKENGQTTTTFFENNPKKIPLFYAELKKFKKINEIKITNLNPTPEKLEKLADNTRIISSLHPKISEIMNTYIPKRMLEDESFKSWKDIFYQLDQSTLNKIYLELHKLTN